MNVAVKGGKREGSGAPKKPDNLLAKNRTIRATDEEWEKCLLLGGNRWLRMMIRKAKL